MTDSFKWNLESMYENDEVVEKDLTVLREKIEGLDAIK